MRISFDLEDKQINALDSMSKRVKRSRAALIREAVAEYLGRHRSANPVDAFGLWGKGEIDGLAYQDKIRAEW